MLRVVTLIENTAGDRQDLVHEHGLSFYVERDGQAVIFDTGAGAGFLYNADKLRIDTKSVRALVVSHAHYDHAGGVRPFYERNGSGIPLITGENFFDPKYKRHRWGHNYIGVDFDSRWLQTMGVDHRGLWAGNSRTVTREIIPGVWAVNGFPGIFPEEKNNPAFVVERNGKIETDDFRDEICLVAETGDCLAVLVACSHPGIMNMLEAIKASFKKRINALIGGIHLIDAKASRVKKFITYAASLNCKCFGIAHCSGKAVQSRMKTDAKRFYHNVTGSSLYL
ncbi:MAG: MBL fold metallo-hydrolase [Spirochaetales bacterium]|jgi:7,8-dihydropterin-6-yl-methyl-4-(beta-D-ribofuranosyl)aminobenzene 5'-phosphate synthase|nr:MBL fold metallo-hydrolase [Spirochaetales bacterium]